LGWPLSRVRWRPVLALGGGFAVTLLALHGIFQAIWGAGYLRSFTYHMDRGIQLESTYAGVIAAGGGFGRPLAVAKEFGAYELVTPLAGLVKTIAFGALALAFAAVLARWAGWRAANDRPEREPALLTLTMLFLLGFMVTNKVFSPQYLLWLAPPMAAAYGARPDFRSGAILLLAAAALSQVIFPRFYDQLTSLQPAMIAVLNLRNATLLVLFGWLLWRLPRLAAAR
jgi:hypothetical protein